MKLPRRKQKTTSNESSSYFDKAASKYLGETIYWGSPGVIVKNFESDNPSTMEPDDKAPIVAEDDKVTWDNEPSTKLDQYKKSMESMNILLFLDLYKSGRSAESIYKILNYIDYPKPWPEVEKIKDIYYHNGKIGIVLEDPNKSSLESNSLDSDYGPGYGVQPIGHKKSASSIVDLSKSKRSENMLNKKLQSNKRSFRITDSEVSNNS